MNLYRLLLMLFLCVSCSNHSQQILYENPDFILKLTMRFDTIWNVKLINKNTSSAYIYETQLIKIDDEVPEGGLYSDYNISNKYDLYTCDSVYLVENDSISITIALERITHKRLDLQINCSKITDLKDGMYTLYKQGN